jgi:hypothetical protein
MIFVSEWRRNTRYREVMAINVQGVEFALNCFEQVILIVRFGLIDLMFTHAKYCEYCRRRSTRLLLQQKETAAGVED